ncbi:MAG: HD domain-containing phosphohydrolase [Desulfobacteraceae bacterium]
MMKKTVSQYSKRTLYVRSTERSEISDVLTSLSRKTDWQVKITDDLKNFLGSDSSSSFKPDFIMMDVFQNSREKCIGRVSDFKKKDNVGNPVFIAVISPETVASQRLYLLENGFDDVLWYPFSVHELVKKTALYLERIELKQQLVLKSRMLERSMETADKYKAGFVRAKKAWNREKELIHNTLKQINIMTLEREDLRREIQTLSTRYQDNLKQLELFIAEMTVARKANNKEHGRRTAEIADFTAEKIKVSPYDRKKLNRAALLHETGLLFVPDLLFAKKKSDLTDYEQKIFDRHPEKGAFFLEKFSGFKEVAEIIRHLHENVDGSGWPDGLKRRSIPLLSRILAGADLLDDLWYANPEQPVEELLVQLEERAGKRLDPGIVHCLGKYALNCLNPQPGKVREVGIYQLEPGMETCEGMFTASGTKLFSAGTVLTEEFIRMMMTYNRSYPLEETISIKVE